MSLSKARDTVRKKSDKFLLKNGRESWESGASSTIHKYKHTYIYFFFHCRKFCFEIMNFLSPIFLVEQTQSTWGWWRIFVLQLLFCDKWIGHIQHYLTHFLFFWPNTLSHTLQVVRSREFIMQPKNMWLICCN